MVSQLLLTRELIIAYSDYELFLGIILGWWLALVGLSSFLSGKLVDRFSLGRKGFALSFFLFPLVLMMQITSIRILQFVKVGGENFIGLWGVVFFSMLILLPSSAIIGFQFPVATKCYRTENPS